MGSERKLDLTGGDSPATGSRSLVDLPQKGKIIAEYVWLGGTGLDIRSKARTFDADKIGDVEDLPVWNYDGSSCGQALGSDSEVYLKPVRIFPDPFRGGDNILVLCESCLPDKDLTPLPSNKRRAADKIFSALKKEEYWFGLEQEYTMFHPDGRTPLGWPRNGFPAPQGPYYCGAGAECAHGRPIVEAHMRACIYAGIKISGVNAEVMAGQWEFQVGPCTGIDAGDELVMARYLMLRIGEMYQVVISFDPKPVSGDWNGAGCHCNFSTKDMRTPGKGNAVVKQCCDRLAAKHVEMMKAYGEGNERRMTGEHETSSIHDFSFGVADRGASIRIPRDFEAKGYGYIEDRRPASNCDPWTVTSLIAQTCSGAK